MHEDTTIPFTNPAYRDELSELTHGGAQRFSTIAGDIDGDVLCLRGDEPVFHNFFHNLPTYPLPPRG